MQVLIISQYFPPDITAAAFRIGETASYLAQKGHHVRIITAEPHKALSENTNGDQRECLRNIKIYRLKILSEGQGGLYGYLRHYLSFLFGSLIIGVNLWFKEWRPSILWVTSPPLFTSISGYILSKLFRCPFILDIRDIWPDSAVSAEQISKTGIAYKIGKILERLSYRWTDHLTVVSTPMARYIQKHTKKPVGVIYNGILKSYLNIDSNDKPFNRILYAGNLGRVQGLDVLVDACYELDKNGILDGWDVAMIGNGAHKERLSELIIKLNLSHKVQIQPAVDKQIAMRELANSRLLFINLKGDDVFRITVPSKVFDYMAVAKPIIAGIDGEGRQILRTTGANILFRSSDQKSLQAALTRAINRIEEFESKASLNKDIVQEKYTREQSCRRLVSYFHAARNGKNAK